MHDMDKRRLEKRLKAYCAYYRMTRLWRLLQHLLFVTAVAAVIYIALDRLLYLGFPWELAAAAAGCVNLLCLLGFVLFAASRPGWVGYTIDRNADLKNLIGTLDRIASSSETRRVSTPSCRKSQPVSASWSQRSRSCRAR